MNFEDVGRVWREQETGDFQRRKIENLSTVRGRAERWLGALHRRQWIYWLTLAIVGATLRLVIAERP